jgi:DNA-binding CsgD family transcriptional regulator
MSSRSLASVPVQPARAAGVLWDALAADAGVNLAIIDADGVIRYANEAFSRFYADREPRALVGERLDDMLPADMGQERMQVVRSVALSGKPVVMKSAWRGVRQRVFIRPLPTRIGGKRAVLVTTRPEHVGESDHTNGTRIVHAKHVDEGPLGVISPRERTVLSLIGQGMSTAQMAATLGRSAKTIENQRYSLARKLGARNRVELARIALRAGLSAPEGIPGGRPTRRRRG